MMDTTMPMNTINEVFVAFWKRYDEDDKQDFSDLRKLVEVYYDALNNPPEGVIGVGAITYAEQKLVEAQQ